MKLSLIKLIERLNPWQGDPGQGFLSQEELITRELLPFLTKPEWDSLWTLLIGPRQAGKTTLGKALAQNLVAQKKRYQNLLYLSCDFKEIRQWIQSEDFLSELEEQFSLRGQILFLDEVQRLESPGLLLKSLGDLNLPCKTIASGSSQLELKSKGQEFLTGRQLAASILPLSFSEIKNRVSLEQILTFGCYPQIVLSHQPKILLAQLYKNYIRQYIIESLKISKVDAMEKLIILMAHSSGQLVDYGQLANDCRISIPTVQHYLDILEKTFVIQKLKPFVGNKRSEITSNPIYYFVDLGFRNQALKNFNPVEHRTELGLLVENFVFQEIFKTKENKVLDFELYFWRTKSGAEVDFVLTQGDEKIFPIEVKYRNFRRSQISRGFRSFLEAYQPSQAVVVTKNWLAKEKIEKTEVHFIPLEKLLDLNGMVEDFFQVKIS